MGADEVTCYVALGVATWLTGQIGAAYGLRQAPFWMAPLPWSPAPDLGHRPLYRIRKLLLMASERLGTAATARLDTDLEAADP